MAYRVVVLESAEGDLERLDADIRRRVLRRLIWLGENASQVVHHQLTSLPEDLVGLCRLRVGDYRILYWVYHPQRLLKVYRIQHRSEVYRRFQ
ncbi:MAG: type II toxin-antitoxin system RelE family toxin [Planctomycetota bacterium]